MKKLLFKFNNKKLDHERSYPDPLGARQPSLSYTTASGSSGWPEAARQANDYRFHNQATFTISPWEHWARLSRLNPIVFQWTSTIGLMALFDQMSRLYPQERTYVLPTGTLLSLVSGGIGFYLGQQALRYPNKEPLSNSKSRAWIVFIDGCCFILPFVLNEAGQYGLQHFCSTPSSTELCPSDADFWGKLFPVPLATTIVYIAWNNISPHQQFSWQLEDRLAWKKWLAKSLNFISEAFLASRTIQMLAAEALHGQVISTEYAALAGALCSVASRTLKPQYRERIQGLLTHARSAALWIYFVRFLKAEFLNQETTFEETRDPWIFGTLVGSSGLFFIVGSVLIYLYHQEYLNNREWLHSVLMTGATLPENQFYDTTHSQSTMQAIVYNQNISHQNKQRVSQNVQEQATRLSGVIHSLQEQVRANNEKHQVQDETIDAKNKIINDLSQQLEALQEQLKIFNVDLESGANNTSAENNTSHIPLNTLLKSSSSPSPEKKPLLTNDSRVSNYSGT